MQESQKRTVQENRKIPTHYGWLTRHGKTRPNCAGEKHVTDIVKQWKAGYRRPDLSP